MTGGKGVAAALIQPVIAAEICGQETGVLGPGGVILAGHGDGDGGQLVITQFDDGGEIPFHLVGEHIVKGSAGGKGV